IPLLFGLGKVQKIDSVVVIWPDNTTETIFNPNLKNPLRISQKEGLPAFNYASLHQETYRFEEITAQIGLEAKHEENKFNEFDREILLPNLLSTEGPALAVADANGDGLDDIFLGNARGFASALYLQKPNGKFEKSLQPAFEKEADFEDIDAVWADVNQDGTLDLIVGSGGNEYFGASPYLQPRLYLNDPQGVLRRDTSAFAGYVINAQVVRVADFNQDSHPDVFVGARSVPFSYGVPPTSYLFLNDGKGRFVEKTPSELANGGMVKDAKVLDLDQDNDPDLVIAYEWGKIVWYENQKESFVPHPLTDRTGWWNFLYPTDLDHDGDLDWVCGNVGLNSRLKATPTEPVRLYVNDFDDNTRTDAVLTYYVQGREKIFADKRELERQMPFIKKQFLRSKEFAKASIQEVLGKKINEARVLQADFLENAWLENKGKGVFELRSLGNQAQYSSYHAAESVGKELLLLGNYYDCNIQMGQYDADWGSIFQNNGKNEWLPKPLLPTRLTGQVRRIANIKIGHQNAYLIARNNEKLMVLKTSKP
ncbi:MAG: FG-GAP-like repeat-containing protein, partial [Runella sp.]